MNTPNNKRRQNTLLKIHTAFLTLLKDKELNEISVTDLCALAEINRTTFYANYSDIHALAHASMERLEAETLEFVGDGLMAENFETSILKLFAHIRENQTRYNTYFKLGLDEKFLIPEHAVLKSNLYHNTPHGKYYVEFFRHGLTAVVKLWLDGGCVETPEEMAEIIRSEYQPRQEKRN